MSRAEKILREMQDAFGETDAHWNILARLRPFCERLARAEAEPSGHDLLVELRTALGLPNVARPETPQQVWKETLEYVRNKIGTYQAIAQRLLHSEVLRAEADREAELLDGVPIKHWRNRALKAEAEVERLRINAEERDTYKRFAETWQERALKAEAEVAPFRAALNERIEQTPQPEGPTVPGANLPMTHYTFSDPTEQLAKRVERLERAHKYPWVSEEIAREVASREVKER